MSSTASATVLPVATETSTCLILLRICPDEHLPPVSGQSCLQLLSWHRSRGSGQIGSACVRTRQHSVPECWFSSHRENPSVRPSGPAPPRAPRSFTKGGSHVPHNSCLRGETRQASEAPEALAEIHRYAGTQNVATRVCIEPWGRFDGIDVHLDFEDAGTALTWLDTLNEIGRAQEAITRLDETTDSRIRARFLREQVQGSVGPAPGRVPLSLTAWTEVIQQTRSRRRCPEVSICPNP